MSHSPFTESELEFIFEQSENNLPTGVDKEDYRGHAGRKHTYITNEELLRRMSEDREMAFYTAFLTFRQQITAATLFLNSSNSSEAVDKFSRKKHGDIYSFPSFRMLPPIRMRYAMGSIVKTYPCSAFKLVAVKDDARPRSMHIVSFYGALGTLPGDEALMKAAEASFKTR